MDRWAPTSKTCSRCGWVKPKLSLAERMFHCDDCGLVK
ncbi:transposase [Dietzia sp. CQ4]|nr:transposase [Dietzia sp. CQ4]